MTSARQGLGRLGETLVAERLLADGYEIVARNWRCAYGELDIIAKQEDAWVFVEVRTRRGRRFGTPEESLTPAKRRHLATAAQLFLEERQALDDAWRVDLAAVELSPAGALLRIDLTEHAVTGADL